MAFKSKDGSEWTNASAARKQDMRGDSKPLGKVAAPVADEPETDTESQEPSAVVAEHGPAHQVLITHKEGSHKIKSKHKDGHTHESEHTSAEDAHMAAKQLAGVGESAAPEDETGDELHGNPAASMMG